MKNFIKKHILILAFGIAFAESLIMFYFYSVNSSHSIILMFLSYAILLFFPLSIFIISFKEYRTKTTLTSLEQTEKNTQHKKELAQFSNTKLQFYRKTFSLKLKTVYTLIENNNFDEAEKLLGKPVIYENTISICNTNPVVDGVLRNKKMVCEKCGILFNYSILFPEKTTLSNSILISLFSNLLDNAIEGCVASRVSNPQIVLSIDYKGDFLIIYLKNTKTVANSFDNHKIKTTKKDSLSHGFGLSIIENIVNLHDGFCDWKDSGNCFESRIMLRYLS